MALPHNVTARTRLAILDLMLDFYLRSSAPCWLGFEREGYARCYLMITGRWEDHVLTALLNPAV